MFLLFAILQFCISDMALVEDTPPCRYILWGKRITKLLGTFSFILQWHVQPPHTSNAVQSFCHLLSRSTACSNEQRSMKRSHFVLLQNYVNCAHCKGAHTVFFKSARNRLTQIRPPILVTDLILLPLAQHQNTKRNFATRVKAQGGLIHRHTRNA